jgi:hypothetical protein
VLQVLGFMGLERIEVPRRSAGDIIAISGIEGLGISDTVCAPDAVEQLPVLTVDEPTISMTFQVNDSPFAGSRSERRQVPDQPPAARPPDPRDPAQRRAEGRGHRPMPTSSRSPAAANCTCRS